MSESVFLKFQSFSVELVNCVDSSLLADFSERFSDQNCGALKSSDLKLKKKSDGLHLLWNKAGEKPLNFYIDVIKVVNQLRSYPAPKQGAFNQALGKKTQHIVDATGGWGGDALLMCTQGYQVTVLERNPVMALMLKDAMSRLAKSDWALDNEVSAPSVVSVDSVEFFTSNRALADIDCVYLDPMFPPKKKKKAAANKQMQLLQWMIGQDLDASQLVQAVLSAGAPRIAVKRPDYAEPLFQKPSNQFSSKLVHYDVYLPS